MSDDQSHETAPVQPASGNRWEPSSPPPASPPPASFPPAGPSRGSFPPAAFPPAGPLPPQPTPARPSRRFGRPGPQFWWSGAAAAVVVLVACAGFVAGRASVDDHAVTPVPIQREFPQDGHLPPQSGQ